MSSPLEKYLDGIELARQLANATEHTYRQYLAQLIGELAGECIAVNEPKRSACGAPDYVVLEKHSRLTRGYMEAKDIGFSLDEAAKSEQLTRYLRSLPNLLLTDYLEFRWSVEDKHRQTIRRAQRQAFLREGVRCADGIDGGWKHAAPLRGVCGPRHLARAGSLHVKMACHGNLPRPFTANRQSPQA